MSGPMEAPWETSSPGQKVSPATEVEMMIVSLPKQMAGIVGMAFIRGKTTCAGGPQTGITIPPQPINLENSK